MEQEALQSHLHVSEQLLLQFAVHVPVQLVQLPVHPEQFVHDPAQVPVQLVQASVQALEQVPVQVVLHVPEQLPEQVVAKLTLPDPSKVTSAAC